jgi:hypothetical protein
MNKLWVFLILFSTSSCEENVPAKEVNLKIIGGQSFGFCVGPCFQTLTVNGDNSEVEFYVRYSESKGNQNTLKEERYSETLKEKDWQDILNAASNIDGFRALEEVYGCPDCADGGSEFIEIVKNNETHRVTFEFGKSVEGFEKLIELMHNQRAIYSEKYVK